MKKEQYNEKQWKKQLEFKKAYIKKHVKNLTLSLNDVTDKDIIAFLNSKESKAGYIKDLIRKDMNNGN